MTNRITSKDSLTDPYTKEKCTSVSIQSLTYWTDLLNCLTELTYWTDLLNWLIELPNWTDELTDWTELINWLTCLWAAMEGGSMLQKKTGSGM